MEALNLKSELARHLESADAYTLSALAPADYDHAVHLYCSERNPLANELRHASTIDLDSDVMLPAIAACADLAAARTINDQPRINALLHLMGECVEQALRAAASEKVSDELYTIAQRAQIDTRHFLYSPAKGLRWVQP